MYDYLTQEDLKNIYGVTPSLMKEYFQNPDKTEPNKYNPRRRMKLFKRSNVQNIINSPEYVAAAIKVVKRKIGGRKSAQTRITNQFKKK